jgi:hypothetical protein
MKKSAQKTSWSSNTIIDKSTGTVLFLIELMSTKWIKGFDKSRTSINELDGRTYDVVFDDVAAGVSFINP